MPTKFAQDAQRAINAVLSTGVSRRRGVVVLVFSRRGSRVAGYINDNPYDAARALVEFLLEKYPDATPPAWVRRLTHQGTPDTADSVPVATR
jgi:hypothetical protein